MSGTIETTVEKATPVHDVELTLVLNGQTTVRSVGRGVQLRDVFSDLLSEVGAQTGEELEVGTVTPDGLEIDDGVLFVIDSNGSRQASWDEEVTESMTVVPSTRHHNG